MTNENMEIMEQETTKEMSEPIAVYNDERTLEEIETEAGGGLVALLAGGACVITLCGIIAAAVKNKKAKKADTPKKPKTKLKFFVRVPVEEAIEDVIENVEFEEFNEESTDK